MDDIIYIKNILPIQLKSKVTLVYYVCVVSTALIRQPSKCRNSIRVSTARRQEKKKIAKKS